MANNEKLLAVMDYIEKNPQSWEQSVWYAYRNGAGELTSVHEVFTVEEVNSCGTAFCFAGRAAIMEGKLPPVSNHRSWYVNPVKEEAITFDWDSTIPENVHPIEEYAASVLGLTYDQADILFSGENTMEDLRAMVDAIVENPDIDRYSLRDLTERGKNDDDYHCDCGCMDEDDEIAF